MSRPQVHYAIGQSLLLRPERTVCIHFADGLGIDVDEQQTLKAVYLGSP